MNTGRWEPTASAIEARAREARVLLRKLGEDGVKEKGEDQHIVVVTHGGYLHYFTEDWDGHEKFTGTGWANTEVRNYEFASSEDSDAALVETGESRKQRRGTEHALSKDEQRILRDTAEKGWRALGLQTPPEVAEEAKL